MQITALDKRSCQLKKPNSEDESWPAE